MVVTTEEMRHLIIIRGELGAGLALAASALRLELEDGDSLDIPAGSDDDHAAVVRQQIFVTEYRRVIRVVPYD